MRNVIIIGNSGAARECHWLLEEAARREPDMAFKGFLAFEGYAGDLRDLADLQLGGDDEYAPEPDDVFVIGIGEPKLRQKAFDKWKQRGAAFINLIHPFTTIHPGVLMGEANIVACACFISCGVALGDANYLNGNVVLGHDARIGNYNFFAPFSIVLGEARIGSGNSFGVYSVVMPGAKTGDNNTIAPGAYLYKGCGNDRVMAGNPALDISGRHT